jgi:hypothetical protein
MARAAARGSATAHARESATASEQVEAGSEQHPAVLTALQRLTNRDFGFNQQEWRRWWEVEGQ